MRKHVGRKDSPSVVICSNVIVSVITVFHIYNKSCMCKIPKYSKIAVECVMIQFIAPS